MVGLLNMEEGPEVGTKTNVSRLLPALAPIIDHNGQRCARTDAPPGVDSEHGFGEYFESCPRGKSPVDHLAGGDRERASAAGQKGGAASYDHDGLSH
jgi:hypothetical protein